MADSRPAELARLNGEKETLKVLIREHRDSGADPAIIAPVYDRYLAVKAQADALTEDLRVRPEVVSGPNVGALMARKDQLKEQIRAAKAEGLSAEAIEPIYNEYLAVKSQLDALPDGGAAGSSTATPPPAAAAATAAVLPPLRVAVGEGTPSAGSPGLTSMPSVDELRQSALASGPSGEDLRKPALDLEDNTSGASAAAAATPTAGAAAQTPLPQTAAETAAAVEEKMHEAADEGEIVTEGWLDVEEVKTFGGTAVKRRYALLMDSALVLYHDETRAKEKSRVQLLGAHVRPIVAATTGAALSGFELLTKRGLGRTDVFIAGVRETAKAWFRGLWRQIKALEAAARASLYVPQAPLGFNGRVLHSEWMQVHLQGRWVWRFCVLCDFAFCFYEEFATKSEALAVLDRNGGRVAGATMVPLIGTLRRDPAKDYNMQFVFVLSLPSGEKLPLACYSGDRLKQWYVGIDITARRALQASLDAGEMAFAGQIPAADGKGGAAVAVDFVITSTSRIQLRVALTAEQKAAASQASANPLLHTDLEDDAAGAVAKVLWTQPVGNLVQFRRELKTITFDFGQNLPPVVLTSESAYSICNIVALMFMERARTAARKPTGAAGPA